MAKQTFTTGQVLTAAQMTALQQTAMLGGAAQAKTASYVLVAADAGDAITMSNASPTTITVNTGLFAAGDIVTIINLGAGACTITAGTATVTTSGSLVLAQNQGGVLRFTSASAAIFFQFATPASGDIEGVTAGTGISGGGTSGTVTITNSMATAIDAKGDLVVGTGADTFSRLAVGTNGTTLVADSAEATGLKWAATSSGGGMTLLSTTALSGSTVSLSSISGSYNNLQLLIIAATATSAYQYTIRPNATTGNFRGLRINTTTLAQTNNATLAAMVINANATDTANAYCFNIYDYANSTKVKNVDMFGTFLNTATDGDCNSARGIFNLTAAITSIDIVCTSTFNGGTALLYGVK